MAVCFDSMIDSQTGLHTETEYKAQNTCLIAIKQDLMSIFLKKSR